MAEFGNHREAGVDTRTPEPQYFVNITVLAILHHVGNSISIRVKLARYGTQTVTLSVQRSTHVGKNLKMAPRIARIPAYALRKCCQ